MSKGQSQTGTQTERAPGRCKFKGKAKSVVYVDVENGKTHDVIIIDAPEVSPRSLLGSTISPKEMPSDTYINIDDDDINVDEAENHDKSGGDKDIGSSSSKSSQPALNKMRSSQPANFHAFQFSRQKRSPLKYSKCRRTYSGKAFRHTLFGLSSSYDSSSSDSDSSDCELLDGSSGNIREQWEQAASKKRMCERVLNGDRGLENEASGSEHISDSLKNDEGGKRTKQHEETQFCTTTDTNNEKENLYSSTASRDATTDNPFFTPEEDFVSHLDEAVDQNSPSCSRAHLGEETDISHNKADTRDGGSTFRGAHSISDAEIQNDRHENENEAYNVMRESPDTVDSQFSPENAFFQEEGETVTDESCWRNYEEPFEMQCEHEKTSLEGEEELLHSAEKQDDTHVSYERATSPDVDEIIHQNTCFSNIQSSSSSSCQRAEFNCKEKPFMREQSLWSDQPCSKTHVVNDLIFSSKSEKSVSGETIDHNGHMEHEGELSDGRADSQENEKGKPPSDNLFPNFQKNVTEVDLQTACSTNEEQPALESNNIVRKNTERSSLNATDGNDGPANFNIMGEREKMKETDEYKRAAEEEWASRQRQLQLQAEEAQKLRKRKRAETQRLLDMERRQKERVEEMRETQKKNVETINLKEKLRGEVRKELNRLELIHTDMVSLLRALGIRVGSGFMPTSHEVNAAYKQALLKFHPDRASKTDIRQQVEAEERFKLVSRLKEKLTNCGTLKPRFF